MRDDREPTVDRGMIIDALVRALEPLPFVHAFYEGGAMAHGRLDEWSDIDGYAVVDDDKLDATMDVVRSALSSVSPIEQEYVPDPHWPGLTQSFFRLERASEYLAVDMAVIKVSSDTYFLEPEVHGRSVFHFNRAGRVNAKPFDATSHAKAMEVRRQRVVDRFRIFNCFVQKEINRDHWIEAVDLYQRVTLGALLEVLRMRHGPVHYDFGTRYVHDELPDDIVRKLVRLSFIASPEELRSKYRQATEWFERESGLRKVTE